MGGNETMTKRFTVDEKGYFDKKAMRYVTIDYLMDLVNGQDQQIKETKDAFYEAHKQQQDCLKEVLKLQDEKRELEFKLNTLKKAYACQNCAFNDREMRYLKSLRE